MTPDAVVGGPWHAGERALQQSAGVAERMAAFGARVIRPFMPEQHREFFAQLPWLVVGSVDDGGQPWASALAAPAGFVHSPDEHSLRIDALPSEVDPLAQTMAAGAGRAVGLLGIEPHTRRRNRANGVLRAVDARGFTVDVRQSFGNCPRYIQARAPVFAPLHRVAPVPLRSEQLEGAARRIVGMADTFFIATAHPSVGDAERSHGVDVSHRGGRPGFVRLAGDGTLLVPDFNGNSFFNTLGNIALNPRAGLLFIDFAKGDLVQVAVRAELVLQGPELAAFAGAERLLRMRVESVLYRPCALPLRWGPAEASPHLEAIGAWSEAA